MIYTREDGTFIIDKNNMPYHVIESDLNIWEEVQQRIAGGEETAPEIPMKPDDKMIWNEAEYKWELPLTESIIEKHSSITTERDKRILTGFSYNGFEIQADSGSQAIAHQYLTKHISGVNIFPLIWRTKDNKYMILADIAEFTAFTDAMTLHINTHFSESWAAKDQIDNASSVAEVETIYNNYMGV